MLRNLYTSIFIAAVSLAGGSLQGQELTARRTAGGIEISEGESKVLFYQISSTSSDGKYERSNYVHPLYSLSGEILTEDFPDDHPHHRGIFWAWHQIIKDDSLIADGWSCENISWEVVNASVRKRRNIITLDNEVLWKSTVGAEKGVAIIREHSRIIVHAANEKYRFVDFEIQLRPEVDNLKVGGSDDSKGYGGFSLRFKLPDDIAFLSGDKVVFARELAVEAEPWLDFFGSFEGQQAPPMGVAVFCHPSNPGYPEPWILRSEKSMQNPAFPGRVPVELTSEGWLLRYRLVIHTSDLQAGDLEKLFGEYTE